MVSCFDSVLVTDMVRQLAPKREPNPNVGYCQTDEKHQDIFGFKLLIFSLAVIQCVACGSHSLSLKYSHSIIRTIILI